MPSNRAEELLQELYESAGEHIHASRHSRVGKAFIAAREYLSASRESAVVLRGQMYLDGDREWVYIVGEPIEDAIQEALIDARWRFGPVEVTIRPLTEPTQPKGESDV